MNERVSACMNPCSPESEVTYLEGLTNPVPLPAPFPPTAPGTELTENLPEIIFLKICVYFILFFLRQNRSM